MHRDSLRPIKEENVQPSLLRAAQDSWDAALELGEKFGYKNSQVSVLAPTGTIGFMMDCDTTGIEPDLALVKQKRLVGGGVIKIVNNTVPQALMRLGYPPEQWRKSSITSTRRQHRGRARTSSPSISRCSTARLPDGRRPLDRLARPSANDGGGAAVPFRRDQQDDQHAGGIDGRRHHGSLYRILEDWDSRPWPSTAITPRARSRSRPPARSGGKSCSGSSRGGTRLAASQATRLQPSSRSFSRRARRRKLPNERSSITHKFSGGRPRRLYHRWASTRTAHPGEIFIKMAKEGSTLSGIMDAFALSVSIALQYGVPLRALVDKFVNSRFEPSGYTGNPEIRYAKSVVDYIGRWLGAKFISRGLSGQRRHRGRGSFGRRETCAGAAGQ